MKRTYKDLVWLGLTATGTMIVTGDDGAIIEETAITESLSDMIITMARDEHPEWNVTINSADPYRQAKALLDTVPLPFVEGFVVDTGELFDTWDPKQMHRVCFARLNDKRVGEGEPRHRWVVPITMWPAENRCDFCHFFEPPSKDAYEAPHDLIDMALTIADEGAASILNSELRFAERGGFEVGLDLSTADLDAFDHCERLLDYLFRRRRVVFDADNEYVFRIVEPVE